MSEPLVSPTVAGQHFSLSSTTLIRLHDLEGAPAIEATRGPHGRRRLRFKISALETWFAGRRERQVLGTLTGSRFTRGGAA
jgi:hypothetical protein